MGMMHDYLVEFPLLGVPSQSKQMLLKARIGQEIEPSWTIGKLAEIYVSSEIPISWKISTIDCDKSMQKPRSSVNK